MFEIKCDVIGCEEREPIVGDFLSPMALPAGWRVVSYVVNAMPALNKKTDAVTAIKKFARSVGGDAAKAYEDMVVATLGGEPGVSIVSRPVQRHVCSKHDLLSFDDSEVG